MTASELALKVIAHGVLFQVAPCNAEWSAQLDAYTGLSLNLGDSIARVEFSGFAKGQHREESLITLRAPGPIAGAQVWYRNDPAFRSLVAALAQRHLVYKPQRFLDS